MLPLAILVPPSLAAGVAGTWWAGRLTAMRALGAAEPPRGTFAGSAAGVAGAACFWSGMGATVFPAFDAMSSTPAKIESFRDFTRSAGPPTVARCGGVLACFFVAGASKTATDVLMASPKAPSSSRVRP